MDSKVKFTANAVVKTVAKTPVPWGQILAGVSLFAALVACGRPQFRLKEASVQGGPLVPTCSLGFEKAMGLNRLQEVLVDFAKMQEQVAKADASDTEVKKNCSEKTRNNIKSCYQFLGTAKKEVRQAVCQLQTSSSAQSTSNTPPVLHLEKIQSACDQYRQLYEKLKCEVPLDGALVAAAKTEISPVECLVVVSSFDNAQKLTGVSAASYLTQVKRVLLKNKIPFDENQWREKVTKIRDGKDVVEPSQWTDIELQIPEISSCRPKALVTIEKIKQLTAQQLFSQPVSIQEDPAQLKKEEFIAESLVVKIRDSQVVKAGKSQVSWGFIQRENKKYAMILNTQLDKNAQLRLFDVEQFAQASSVAGDVEKTLDEKIKAKQIDGYQLEKLDTKTWALLAPDFAIESSFIFELEIVSGDLQAPIPAAAPAPAK